MAPPIEKWSGKWTFILTSAGVTFSLSKFWVLPTLVQQHNNGIFLLVYLLGLLLMGLPLLWLEVSLGQSMQHNPIRGVALLASRARGSKLWQVLGLWWVLLGPVFFAFNVLIMSLLAFFLVQFASGEMENLSFTQIAALTEEFSADSQSLLSYYAVLIVLVWLINRSGLRLGVETIAKYLLPLIAVLLLGFLAYYFFSGALQAVINTSLRFDLNSLNLQEICIAFALSFLSLCLARGTFLTFGAYLPKNRNVIASIMWIGLCDALLVVAASLVVLAIVGKSEFSSDAGLIYVVIPHAFAQSLSGSILGFLFFFMLILVVLCRSIGLVEPSIHLLQERFEVPRAIASFWVSMLVFALGVAFYILIRQSISIQINDQFSLFDLINLVPDILALVSIMGLLLFCGWVLQLKDLRNVLVLKHHQWEGIYWSWFRIVLPIALVLIVLVQKIFKFDFS